VTISAIESIASAAIPPTASLPPSQQAGSFGSMLLEGVTRTDASLQQAEQAVAAFAVGGEAPPHQVMLALEEARMSLQLALQVRSRLVEGYQELMRMQL